MVELDDLDFYIELDALSARSVEMLMKPEPGSHIDKVTIDQVRRLHIGTPQGVVSGIGDEAE
jgi:hypothetical protein